jgi:hypothetical protein
MELVLGRSGESSRILQRPLLRFHLDLLGMAAQTHEPEDEGERSSYPGRLAVPICTPHATPRSGCGPRRGDHLSEMTRLLDGAPLDGLPGARFLLEYTQATTGCL